MDYAHSPRDYLLTMAKYFTLQGLSGMQATNNDTAQYPNGKTTKGDIMKENDVFTLDNSDICFETNINRLGGSSAHDDLYVDVYRKDGTRASFIKHFHGQYALTRAVTYIAKLTGEPVASRITRQPSTGR